MCRESMRGDDEKTQEQALQAHNNFKNRGASGWNRKGKAKWKGGMSNESTNGQY